MKLSDVIGGLGQLLSKATTPAMTLEEIEAATVAEGERAVELQKVLEAKQKLEAARQVSRGILKNIDAVGKPVPVEKPKRRAY